MQSRVTQQNLILILCVSAICFIGGTVNGLLGTGGGVFIMLASVIIKKISGKECDAYGLAMTSVLPMSVISLLLYPSGTVYLEFAFSMLIPAILGGCIGAFLKGSVDTKYLSIAFSVLTIYSGINMILGTR